MGVQVLPKDLLPTNAYCYLFSKEILHERFIGNKNAFDVELFGSIPGRILAYFADPEVSRMWHHLSVPEDLLEVELFASGHPELFETRCVTYQQGNIQVQNCTIGEGVQLKGDTSLINCIVGNGCALADITASDTVFLPDSMLAESALHRCLVSGDFTVYNATLIQGPLIEIVMIAGDDGFVHMTPVMHQDKVPKVLKLAVH